MEAQSYNSFWNKLYELAKNRQFPLRVMFELTYRCNFYCRHCYVPFSYRKYKELKTKEVFSVLDQLAEMGCFYLGFTGGEPFLREDIMEILLYAKRKGFELIIYTNGALIDEKIADELQDLAPNKVDITLPAMSKESFERITEMHGSHRKVFDAVGLLYKRKVNLGFKTCVLKENEDEISQIQDFATSLGALHRLDDMLSACLDGSDVPFKYRGVLEEDLSVTFPLRQKDITKCEPKDCNPEPTIPNPQFTTLFKCGVGTSQAAITPWGELKMCLMIDYPKYKILDTSLKKCWQRLKELVSNIKPDKDYKCDICELYLYCKWCPARGWLYKKSFTSCEPESRGKAEVMRNLFHWGDGNKITLGK